ncbi:glutaredoxin-3-like isoform X1 [Macrosteles quadrilineatus]|uniref:glutaredoxin-3-like isoform X1 n=1 Tax=Macrosteles quadrilineatus TaxID=74068 RepID=UPI0023E0B6CE|nr:glutaredoxin-3-like isoform X1 [Macrosteles quadrilineatus]
MVVISIVKTEEFKDLTGGENLAVVHFYADWAEQCKDMNDVMVELSNNPELKDVKFGKLLAEDIPEISMEHKITAVPTFLLLRKGKLVDRVDGANAAVLTQKVTRQASKVMIPPIARKPEQSLESRLKSLTNMAPVMLFMKGNPAEPKCGFSRQIIQLLNEQNVSFKTFDILQDNEVREGLKKFSDWPTYPQLYINGELVGGLDIVKELVTSGELKTMLPKSLEDRLKGLIEKEDVMLFMKGSPEQPRCGFSRQIIEILNSTKVKYGTFDILEDDEVRQGLKEFSNWPTYPQLYVKGELVGGNN